MIFTVITLVALMAACAPVLAADDASAKSANAEPVARDPFATRYDEITARDGTVYRRASPQRIEDGTLVCIHSSGIARIPLDNLPDDIRGDLGLPSLAVAQQERARERAEAERKRAAQERLNAIPHFGSKINVGDIGRFRYSVTVTRIINNNEMIARTVSGMQKGIVAGAGTRKNPRRYHPDTEIHGPTVWIKGISTAGIADGHKLKPEGVFRATGTDTLHGAITYIVLVPHSID